jgi:hypothetical protein
MKSIFQRSIRNSVHEIILVLKWYDFVYESKITFNIEAAVKNQKESRGAALLFL